MSFEEIKDNLEFMDDWEDRYRYIIELGNELPPLSEEQQSDDNKVHGCVSQVWLATTVSQDGNSAPVLHFAGISDAHIVSGLVAVVLALYSGQSAQDILKIDARKILSEIGLDEHLTPQRSNGLQAMVERIQNDARQALV